MKYLHLMLRICNVEKSLHFFCDLLGLQEVRRAEHPEGRFTLLFLATGIGESEIELTYNWDVPDLYESGRNFGHLAFGVENIYEICSKLLRENVTIARPPRDGRMAFIKSPDGISVELLQIGKPLSPVEPWVSMKNIGQW